MVDKKTLAGQLISQCLRLLCSWLLSGGQTVIHDIVYKSSKKNNTKYIVLTNFVYFQNLIHLIKHVSSL